MVNLTEMKSKPDIALSGDRTEASEQESKCEASKTVPDSDSGNRGGNSLALKKHGRRTKLTVIGAIRSTRQNRGTCLKTKRIMKKMAMALKPS